MFVDILTNILRYVFVLLAGFVVLRGLLWLRRDTRQYKKIVRRLPDAGLIGEIYCPANGKKVQLPREGSMGRFTSCDVKLKGNGVRGIHAHFLFVPGKGLKITPRPGKPVRADGRKVRGSAVLGSGSELVLGNERFIVRFFAGLNVPRGGAVPAAGRGNEMYEFGTEDSFYPENAYPYGIPVNGSAAPEEAGYEGVPEGWGDMPAGEYGSPRHVPAQYPPVRGMPDGQEETAGAYGNDEEDWGPDQ